jgi:hypothetical protein
MTDAARMNMMLVPYGGKPFEETKEEFDARVSEAFLREFERLIFEAFVGGPYNEPELEVMGHREDGTPIYGEIFDAPLDDYGTPPYMS